jgi:hypothetical protein
MMKRMMVNRIFSHNRSCGSRLFLCRHLPLFHESVMLVFLRVAQVRYPAARLLLRLSPSNVPARRRMSASTASYLAVPVNLKEP